MSNSPSPFCSVLSMAGSEPISGTAISATGYVFISWPKKYWSRKQFESTDFPHALADYLNRIQRERHITTRLIYRNGETIKGRSKILIMPDRVEFDAVPVDEIMETLERYFDEKPVGKYGPKRIVGTYLFCCTHGKRDKCCAKFGQAIASEIDSLARAKGFDLSVWECTHLGADRLAATSLSFPSGFMYGRMRIEHVPHIIESLKTEVPYSPCYRGRLGTNAVYQVAEAYGFSHAFANNLRDPDVAVEDVTEHDNGTKYTTTVTVVNRSSRRPVALFTLTIEKRFYSTYVDCDALAANSFKALPRWVVTNAELLPNDQH